MVNDDLCAELPGLIGEAAAHAFFQYYGGRSVYFPRRPSDELVQVVGVVLAERLCRRYAGSVYQVSMRCNDKRLARNEAMRSQFDRLCVGERTASSVVYELARRYGLSSRTVWRVLGEA